MVKKILICAGVAFLLMFGSAAKAAKMVAVIPVFSGDSSSDASSLDAALIIKNSFSRLGRYIPVPEVLLAGIDPSVLRSEDGSDAVFHDTGAEIIVRVNVQMVINGALGSIQIISHDKRSTVKTVQSRYISMIPLFLEREIVAFHEKIPLSFSVTSDADGLKVIDAGDFHGLEKGKSYSVNTGETIEVADTTRYTSLIKTSASFSKGIHTIALYPDVSAEQARVAHEIELQIIRRHGAEFTMLAGIPDPEKRFVEGTLVVNMGSNLFLPGYGSFLSTYYMGFKDPTPSYAGVGMTMGVEAFQLFYLASQDGFNKGFIPWLDDSRMNHADRRLNRFLWGTIPVTWAVSYCDQLAFQYDRSRTLPPFFSDADRSALVLSAFIPGGGLFYKDYRAAGWSFYLSELSLCGYYVKHSGEQKGKYALYGAGAVKLVELFSSYFLDNSYSFFHEEADEKKTPRLQLSVVPLKGSMVYSAGVSLLY